MEPRNPRGPWPADYVKPLAVELCEKITPATAAGRVEVFQEQGNAACPRWWVRCPLCARRCRAVYLPPGRESFGCVDCYHLGYGRDSLSKSRRDNKKKRLEEIHRENVRATDEYRNLQAWIAAHPNHATDPALAAYVNKQMKLAEEAAKEAGYLAELERADAAKRARQGNRSRRYKARP